MTVLIIDAGMNIEAEAVKALGRAGWRVGDEDQVADLGQGELIYLFAPLGQQETQAHARIRDQALALAPHIRVNGICAGPVVAHNEQWSSLSLSPMVPTADIVSTVRFILETGAMTGQVIALDQF